MRSMEELSASLKRATAVSIGSAAILTWFFSALQCNKEHCYTTDNPIVQVALAGALATGTIMAVTSAPVLKTIEPLTKPISKKINDTTDYLTGIFTSKKVATPETPCSQQPACPPSSPMHP